MQNGIITENHYDIVNNIHNLVNQNNVEAEEEEDDDDDEPPPLPPPRGESLTRSMQTDQLSNDSTPENGQSYSNSLGVGGAKWIFLTF